MEGLSFEERVAVVAEQIRAAKKVVLYIGAGASASSGVPTFHGTGAARSLLEVREDGLAFPNTTHRCAMEMMRSLPQVAGAVSSNHDGLVSGEHVVEIFGSVLTESCLECKTRFRRRFPISGLGRKCEQCGGKLKKTGCRYGQDIYAPGLRAAENFAENCDLALVLGSGMHTWPLSAHNNGFPMRAARCVLVTLGETAADHLEGAESFDRFDCECDEFMTALARQLELRVPRSIFEQKMILSANRQLNGAIRVSLLAEDHNENVVFASEGTANGVDLTRVPGGWATEVAEDTQEIVLEMRPRDEFGAVPVWKSNVLVVGSEPIQAVFVQEM